MCNNYKPNSSSPNQTQQSTYIVKASITSCCLCVCLLIDIFPLVCTAIFLKTGTVPYSFLYLPQCLSHNRCSINGGWMNVKNIKLWKGKVEATGHRQKDKHRELARKHSTMRRGQAGKGRKRATCSMPYLRAEELHRYHALNPPTAWLRTLRPERKSNLPTISHRLHMEPGLIGLLRQIVSLSPVS